MRVALRKITTKGDVLAFPGAADPTPVLARKAFEGIRCRMEFTCSELYEDVEEEQVVEEEEPSDVEEAVELPVAESGYHLYVCSQCGSALTEIPYYNRFLCENCGLHY